MRRAMIWLACLTALGGCGDPLRDVERLSDVPVAPDSGTAAVAPGPEETGDAPGFLGRLFGGTGAAAAAVPPAADAEAETGETAADVVSDPAAVPAAAGAGAETGETAADLVPDTAAMDVTGAELATAAPPQPAVADPPRRGLAALFAPRGNPPAPTAAATAEPPAAPPTAASDGPALRAIAPGTLLPYGQVAVVCDVPQSALGRATGQAAGFTMYDTAPDSTALRTHYITGFDDRCARQFSAALALFGDLTTHELIRYLPGGPSDAYSATDRAYEEIKGQVCGVPAGQPCGNRIARLSRLTAYVTIYQTFGTNPDWSEMLLHDGAVAAVSFEGG